MPSLSLDAVDAAELAELLRFIRQWLGGTDHASSRPHSAASSAPRATTSPNCAPTWPASPSCSATTTASNSSGLARADRALSARPVSRSAPQGVRRHKIFGTHQRDKRWAGRQTCTSPLHVDRSHLTRREAPCAPAQERRGATGTRSSPDDRRCGDPMCRQGPDSGSC